MGANQQIQHLQQELVRLKLQIFAAFRALSESQGFGQEIGAQLASLEKECNTVRRVLLDEQTHHEAVLRQSKEKVEEFCLEAQLSARRARHF